MKTVLTIGLLSGALAASAGLNLVHTIGNQPVTVTESEPPACTGCAQSCPPNCRIAEELGLTEAQCRELTGCSVGQCVHRRGEHAQRIEALTSELESELDADSVDRARLDQLVTEIAQLRAQELKNRIECILKVRATLTPEQRRRLIATVENP